MENKSFFNLDVSNNSGYTDIPSFIKKLKTIKIYNNNMDNKNNILDTSQLKSTKTLNNIINKNKKIIGYHKKRKISGDNFSNELNLSSSLNSDSFNTSIHKNAKTVKNEINKGFLRFYNLTQQESKKNNVYNKINKLKNSKTVKLREMKQINNKNYREKKTIENLKVKKENESNNFLSLPKKKDSNQKKTSTFLITKDSLKTSNVNNDNYLKKRTINSKTESDLDLNNKSSISETIIYCNHDNEEITNNNNDTKILTLEDINQNFSKKIKKKLNRRKKIQKIKELIKMQYKYFIESFFL